MFPIKLFVLIALSLSGCSTAKKASDFKGEFSQVDSLVILPLQVSINRIDAGASTLDIPGGESAAKSLKGVIREWKAVRTVFVDERHSDSYRKQDYDSACSAILHEIQLFKTIDGVRVDSTFVSKYLDERTKYAGLFVFSGFSRSTNSKAYTFGKTLLIGILTFGMIIPASMMDATQIEFVVINAKSLRVIFYDVAGGDSSPRDKKSIEKYFYKAVEDLRGHW